MFIEGIGEIFDRALKIIVIKKTFFRAVTFEIIYIAPKTIYVQVENTNTSILQNTLCCVR